MKTWKDIKGYKGIYQVNRSGDVLSYHNEVKILKVTKDGGGYFTVVLCKNGNKKRYKNHRLVAQAFIPNLKNKPQVNHKNGIKTDNRVENLEWATSKENIIHSYKIGLSNQKSRRKIREEDIKDIIDKYEPYLYGYSKIANDYNVDYRVIWNIVNKTTYKRRIT